MRIKRTIAEVYTYRTAGFLRVRCEGCHHERLVTFSCKRRGICPSCGARRMSESAALLVDDVLPHQPIRQWVLSFPFPLRFLLASYPELMGKGAGHCSAGALHPFDQESWIDPGDGTNRVGHSDSALRYCQLRSPELIESVHEYIQTP